MLIIKLFIYAVQLLSMLADKTTLLSSEGNLIPIKVNISADPNDEMVKSEYTKKAFSNDHYNSELFSILASDPPP